MNNNKVILITKYLPLASEPSPAERLITFPEKLRHFSPIYLKDYLRLGQIKKNVNVVGKIDNHLFDVCDLVNYCKNNRNYVYNPGNRNDFVNPTKLNYLNGLYLFDFLSRHGIEVEFINNALTDRAELIDALKQDPMAVVISAIFLSLDTVRKISKFIKKSNPEVKIILGGKTLLLHLDENRNPTSYFSELFKGYVDYIIFEEQGELTLVNLLKTLGKNGDISEVKNLAYYNGSKLISNSREKENGDIDKDFPRWDRLSKDYTNGTAYTMASQGCPYRCKFCNFHFLIKGVKYRTIDSLKEEMKLMAKNGNIRAVAFNDDNLGQNSKRLGAIAKMMIDEKFNFRWIGLVRADTITKETARLMKDSGCELVNIGVESGDATILKNMNKGTTPDINSRAIDILYENGISAYGTFIIGFPGETEETIQNTINWINSTPLKLYKPIVFGWHPRTEIDKERDQYGLTHMGKLKHPMLWKHNTMDAVRASEYFRDILINVKHAYTTLFHTSPVILLPLFFNKGYSREEVIKMLKIKTDMVKLELNNNLTKKHRLKKREQLLQSLERMIK